MQINYNATVIYKELYRIFLSCDADNFQFAYCLTDCFRIYLSTFIAC